MIFSDGIHLVTDGDIGELHTFARKIGLKKKWFQDTRHPHYDLTTVKMTMKAILAGAKHVPPRELINHVARRNQ